MAVVVTRTRSKLLAHPSEEVMRRADAIVQRVGIALSNALLEETNGPSLKRRSSSFAKSWTLGGGAKWTKTRREGSVRGTLGSTHPAARIQERGGRITPKSGKYLSIPLDAAKMASGQARYASPLEVAGLHIMRAKNPAHLLLALDGVPLFVLVPSVTLKATRYLSKSVDRVRKQVGALASIGWRS